MLKAEFLRELEMKLSGLPAEDVEERLSFYSEMIDDRMEEGLSEEEAVEAIGLTDDIYKETVSDIPLTKLVKKKFTLDRGLKAGEIALIVLGFPIWFPIIVALLAVVFSVYVSLWSVIISLWAVGGAIAASGFGVLVSAIIFILTGSVSTCIAAIGAGLFALGFCIFFFYGCKMATMGILWITRKVTLFIKSMFIRKENLL